MASEMLKSVLEAEKTAAEAELDAANIADNITNNAVAQAAAIIQSKTELASEEAEAVKLEAMEQAQAIDSAAVKEAEAACAAIAAAAQAKRALAVDTVIKLILNPDP